MYCANCGSLQHETSNFCSICGSALQGNGEQTAMLQPAFSARVGFSPQISDPAFDKYRKNSKIWSYLFASILAVVAMVGFPIYGRASGDIDWPYSLYYGMGIGGMFLLIAFFQALKRNLDTTWDGVVIDKRSYKRREYNKSRGRFYTVNIYEYKVQSDSGKVHKHRSRNNAAMYNYYNVGERVRHHKGFYVYEKYDKTQGEKLYCIACASLNDAGLDTCPRCKCPIL